MGQEDDELEDTGAEPKQPTSEDFKALRKRAKAYDDAAAENARLKRELAMTKAGLDLTERQAKAFWAAHEDGDLSKEAIRATAVELRFLEAEEEESEQDIDARAAAERINRAVATATTRGKGALLTVEDVAEWTHEKKRRFMDKNPDAWEQLKRGESVSVVGGF
ncbi:MAG: hypothetical protein WAT66_14595 [Actinomycetota bacterium]